MPKKWRKDEEFCHWCGKFTEQKEYMKTYKESTGELDRVHFKTRCSNWRCRGIKSTTSMNANVYHRYVRDYCD